MTEEEKDIQDKIDILLGVQIKTMDKYTAKQYFKEVYEYLLPKQDYETLAKIRTVEEEFLD